MIATDLTGNIIGAFDFFVVYDPAVLAFDAVVFGTALGGESDSLRIDDASPAGNVNVVELSFLSDLPALQDGVSDQLLFSISFDTLASGSSSLDFDENILGFAGGYLGDENGIGIVLDNIGAGSITVNTSPTISEPGSLALLLLGLAGARSVHSIKTRS